MAALIEALPDAVALQCLARVPLSQHSNIRLVCKAWYSVVQNPELFQVRKTIGAVEEWLYVCSYEPDKIWQAYDPLYNKWTILPPLPSAVQNLAYFGSIGIDGRLFVLGGGGDYVNPATGDREGPEVTQEVWAYDPVFRRWNSMAPMLMARRNFACFAYEGRIVVAGGFTDNSKSTLTVEVYDLEANEWQPLADLKEASVPVCSGVVLDGKMRVIQRAERVSQVYDSALNRWVLEECSWAGGPMAVVKGKLYVVGHGVVSREHHCHTHRLSPLCAGPKCLNRVGFGVAGLGTDLYVVGGVLWPPANQKLEYLDDVDICNVESGREENLVWRKGACIPLSKGTVFGCTVLQL